MKIMCVDPSRFTLGTKVVISNAKDGSVVFSTSIVTAVPGLVSQLFQLATEYEVSQIYCDNSGIGMAIYDNLLEKSQSLYTNVTVHPLER